jgi:tetratricopeptide (TPR) repeat protein
MVLHDYASAESAFAKAAVPRNPFLNYTLQMLGHTMVAEEKFEEAEQQFRAALKFSPAPILFGLSDALVAQGRFDEAARYLDETNRSAPDAEVERAMRRATLLIAQQKLPAATAAIESALSVANRLPSPNARWRAHAAMIALRTALENQAAARVLAAGQLGELSAEARANANLMVMEELLYAAGWAARLGLVNEASEVLALARRHGSLDRFPVRARLAAIAQAEIDLRAGHADAVLARLQPQAGNELWEVHELRARALRATGDTAGEIAELTWLASRRGRAYGQWTDQLLGQQARVLDLTEAKARLAEYSRPR